MFQTSPCSTLNQAVMLSSIFNLDHKLEEVPPAFPDPVKTKYCSLCVTFQYNYKMGILEAIGRTIAVFGLEMCLPSLLALSVGSSSVFPSLPLLSLLV